MRVNRLIREKSCHFKFAIMMGIRHSTIVSLKKYLESASHCFYIKRYFYSICKLIPKSPYQIEELTLGL